LLLLGKNWNFNWHDERKIHAVYKLVIKGNPGIIQGLVSISDEEDHYYIHLIENAPFNIGKDKMYEGVAGNLFAFVCALAVEKGYNGYVSFLANSQLIAHYEQTLGAKRVGNSSLTVIEGEQSRMLIEKYLKGK